MYQDLINNHRKTGDRLHQRAISRKGRKYNVPHALLRLLDPIDPCQKKMCLKRSSSKNKNYDISLIIKDPNHLCNALVV